MDGKENGKNGMRRALHPILRLAVSGLAAFMLLNIFCLVYFNMPLTIPCGDGVTVTKWEPNTFYCRAREGFGWARLNNDGYNNAFDFEPGKDRIDILIMGSSQMEGLQVPQGDTAASRLDSMLTGRTVYNVGISGHHFLVCAQHLEAALQKYRPSEYVVMVAENISCSDEALNDVLNGTPLLKSTISENRAVSLLRRIPYIHLLNDQRKKYLESRKEQLVPAADSPDRPESCDEALLDRFLGGLRDTAGAYDTRILILYLPPVGLERDGNLAIGGDAAELERFGALCEKNGILFFDMSARYAAEYAEHHILPYGFHNSSVGKGHLNRNGHAMIAGELYRLIGE